MTISNSSLSIILNQLIRVYQIWDYHQKIDQQYSKNLLEALFIVASIVSAVSRSTTSKATISRSTTKAHFASPSSYSVEWVTDRSRLIQNIKNFVADIAHYRSIVQYHNYLATIDQLSKQYHRVARRSETITPSNKKHFIDVTLELTSTISSKQRQRARISSDSISKLVLSSIESAFATINQIDNFDTRVSLTNKIVDSSNSIIDIDFFNKLTFTSLFTTMSDWKEFEFTKQQWNALQAMLDARIISSNTTSDNLDDDDSNNDDDHNNRWNTIKIEFFDSHYDDKIAIIVSIIEHARKNIYFRDVHVFIERIKNMFVIKEAKLIATICIFACEM